MKKTCLLGMLAALVLTLCGCGGKNEDIQTFVQETIPEPTIAATVPADGNPGDATCKGSYTGEENRHALVARLGDAVLTNDQLGAYYWAEVAAYQASGETPAPDFDRPLDTQACGADNSVNSWQQYFLRRALNTWHSAQALILQGSEEGLPSEERYQPNLKNYEKYMTDMPATKFLYRYEKAFKPNTMHQAYLDSIPQMLEDLASQKGYASAEELAQKAFGCSLDALETFAEDYNRGYMYYTNLTYFIEPTEEELENHFLQWEQAQKDAGNPIPEGNYVDIRHILLIPEGTSEEETFVDVDGTVQASEEQWETCLSEAESLLGHWKRETKHTEATFAELANKNSQDTGSALNGGAYRRVSQGQLLPELDSWCFEEGREPGDTTILRTGHGVHILYFSNGCSVAQAEAKDTLLAEKQADILTVARSQYSMEVEYGDISLAEGEGTVSLSDVLYPDIAHERFPEIPLYLQQDYPTTMYGGFKITTNGCGITTMAMLATYMADEELTPPEMCDRYGRYSSVSGTDGFIFNNEPAVMGFYLREKTYNPQVAYAALEEGQVVVSIQHKGYWTRGGHYIALEKLLEDGNVQVRDSNIYNYSRIGAQHKLDRHAWKDITAHGSGFWIFEDKVTRIPACVRCGDMDGILKDVTGVPMQQDYTCEKCIPALARRNHYLNNC